MALKGDMLKWIQEVRDYGFSRQEPNLSLPS